MNQWYSASDSPQLVEFGTVRGLGATGVGAPGGPEHLAAIQSLYAVVAQLLGDRLPPLEGRWWAEDDRPSLTVPHAQWRWHLFVRLPESIAPAQEPKTLARIDRFIQERGLVANGLHHELYLSDVRETDPAKMQTILRQPVRAS
jgi:hypothetical protein